MKTKIVNIGIILLILLVSIGTAQAGILPPTFNPLSIGGVVSGSSVTHELGTPYSAALSIPYVGTKDTTCTDGYCDDIFGGWVVLDVNKNIIWNSAWTSLTASPYTTSGTIPFTTAGKYYVVGTVIKQSMSYTGGAWVSNPSVTLATEGIEINVVRPTTVVLSPASPIINVGTTVQMTALVQDNNGAVMNGKTITYISNNPAIATITTGGLVTGVSIGTATITATHSTTTATITDSEVVTVNAPGVVITPPSGFAAFLAALWAFLRTLFPFLPASV